MAAVQGGYINLAQLRALDLSEAAIRHMIRTAYLIPVHPRVFAVGVDSINPLNRCHGALLSIGDSAWIARWSAAAVWGVRKEWPNVPEVITTRTHKSRRAKQDSTYRPVKVLHSRQLAEQDQRVNLDVPVVSPALMVLQTAAGLTEKQLLRMIDDLRLRLLLNPGQLEDVLTRFPHARGARALRNALGLAHPEPTRSVWEQDWRQFAERYELPAYALNVMVGPYRVDILFLPDRLIVELDGFTTHQGFHAFKRDRNQDAQILASHGIPTIRLVKQDFEKEPEATAQRILQVLQR